MQVISVSQDHRVLPSTLPKNLEERVFSSLPSRADVKPVIFQIHLAVSTLFFNRLPTTANNPTDAVFDNVKLRVE